MPSSGVQTCARSEEHTSELQSHDNLVCRLLLEKTKQDRSRQPTSSRAQINGSARPRTRVNVSRPAVLLYSRHALLVRAVVSRFFFFLKERGPPESPPLPPPRPFRS